MAHGTRACYARGCRRLACRAANAAYMAQYRQDQAHGKQRLGSIISSTEARRRLHQLQAEHVPVAERLGLKSRRVRLHPSGVRLWKLLQLRWLCRQHGILEPVIRGGTNGPNLQNP